LEEQIFLCRVLPDKEIDVADTRENFRAVTEISGRQPYLILVDGTGGSSVTKEGMEDAARPEVQVNLIAQAIVVKTLANRLLGNFIIKFHRPSAPTKLFSDCETALNWLKEIKKEKNRLSLQSNIFI